MPRLPEDIHQKDGFRVPLNDVDIALVSQFQKRYAEIGVHKMYVSALEHKRNKCSPAYLKNLTKKGGLSVGEAMEFAEALAKGDTLAAIVLQEKLRDGKVPLVSLVPYVTAPKHTTNWVLRLQLSMLEKGGAIPMSNVKVADCNRDLRIDKIKAEFTRDAARLLVADYLQLYEARLYSPPKHAA